MSEPVVRELRDVEDMEDVRLLFDRIWGPDPGGAAVTVELLRALAHSGNYVAGAYQGGTLVGASVGFLGRPAGEVLHSHITGAASGRGIGLALKLHQREWALRHGLARITWTFDPLVRRNAHFNLAKLGARPEEYLTSFYGPMDDAINAGDESDRLLAVWRLAEAHPAVAVPAGTPMALGVRDGLPVAGAVDGAGTVLVALPEDIEGMRRRDPGAAKAWRHALREVLGGLMVAGGRVTGFHDKSYYVVERGAL
ncbi:GNAT family N-acetyltransferase [Thermocatellispora tengchongensis]|uniref:GNAT family N-acetyltransferase n=1 Tax=Thermocatellispora tengchongensis TaxID=1073253 RepID=UPI00161FD4BF